MNRQGVSLVSLLSLLLVAGSAIAQTIRVRGDIPFNFVVGSKTYPAADPNQVGFQSGAKYFVSQIWMNGETCGHQLQKSSREKEVAKDMARNLPQEQVEVLASLY